MSNQAVTDLKAAREIIADPKRWTQDAGARDERGNIVPVWVPEATSFCAIGAISRVCENSADRYNEARRYAYAYLHEAYAGRDICIPDVNDDEGYEAVLKMFDGAIALAEASA